MKNLGRALAILVTALSITSVAGIRGPGKYCGVVVFDRWETCYIYSGVYLMYVSEKVKEPLREFQGRAMVVDALRVIQPMNPGDGLIERLRVIGPATTKRPEVQRNLLSLKVSPRFTAAATKFVLEIQNRSTRRIEVCSDELALTLLGRKTKSNSTFSPSDGLSTALITRTSFRDSRISGMSNYRDACFWTIGDRPLPNLFTLKAREKYAITISLVLPRGEYDFLCGYAGGVHYDKSLASNIVAFDVNENERATLVDISARHASPLR